jgi:hypothetical protein
LLLHVSQDEVLWAVVESAHLDALLLPSCLAQVSEAVTVRILSAAVTQAIDGQAARRANEEVREPLLIAIPQVGVARQLLAQVRDDVVCLSADPML